MNDSLPLDKVFAAIMGGFLVPVFEFFYGTGTVVLYTMLVLAFFIGMDWLAGIRASKKDDTYASHYGKDGAFRTFFMLLLPGGGHLLDMLFNIPGFLFGLLAWGLIYHTLQSMTANCIRAGWANWLPISFLEIVTGWVKSELDSKIFRAQRRLEEKGVSQDE